MRYCEFDKLIYIVISILLNFTRRDLDIKKTLLYFIRNFW
jgi:hypothetical protein